MSTDKQNVVGPGAVRADDVHQTTSDHHEAGTPSVAQSVPFDARRRAAARRLPVLEHGTADPLDRIAREPLPDIPRNLIAARRAWGHLSELGYLDRAALEDPAAREFWFRALGVAA